jgi:hypothetical protein
MAQCQAARTGDEGLVQCQGRIGKPVPLYLRRRGRPTTTNVCLCSQHSKRAESGEEMKVFTDLGLFQASINPPAAAPKPKKSYYVPVSREPVTELTPVKERDISPGQYVRAYYNLRRRCFSIQDGQTKKVLAHTPSLTIGDAQFIVYESGRKQVLATNSKNVHAFVVGRFLGTEVVDTEGCRAGRYNPYKAASFVDRETNEPLTGIFPVVHCAGNSVFYRVSGQEEAPEMVVETA